MPNDKIYSEIVSSLVKTKYDAVLLLSELDVLERSLYKLGDEDFEHTLEKGVRAKTAYAINKIIEGKEKAIKLLKEETEKVTFLSLTIAFEPTLEVLTRIHSWVKENVGSGIALDISIDKSILGGAIIEYNGHIFKGTLSSKVDQYFLNNSHANV